MKSVALILMASLLSLFVRAQWSQSGSNITTTNNVGIGITPPSALLHVHNPSSLGTTAGSMIELARVSGVNTNTSQLRFQLNRYASGNDWYSASMRLQHVIDNTNMGYIEFSPVNGNAGVAIGSGNIEIARFVYSGSASPSTKLDVSGALAIGSGSVNTNNTKLFIRNPASNTWAISSGMNSINESDFGIYNWTGNQSTPLLDISSGGNVGIGVVIPSSMLHIKGSSADATINLESNNSNSFWQLSNIQSTANFAIIDAKTGTAPFIINKGTPTNTLQLTNNGNVIIGQPSTINSAYMLNVGGFIRANKVVVNTTGADFVFDSSYHLKALSEVEEYVQQNKHLPEIETAAEMQKDGVDLGINQTKLLQKIEELTLYLIKQDKEIKLLKKELIHRGK